MSEFQEHPLTAFRSKRNLSLAELAAKIGVTPATVFRWESGARTPKPAHLAALNKLTGISIGALMGIENARNRKGRNDGKAEGFAK